MDTVIPYLRTQAELLTELSAKVRDGSHARWTAVEKYTALNEVLMTWNQKVRFPHLYTISGGWQVTDYDYTLPSYVKPPLFPQVLRRQPHVDYWVSSGIVNSWQDLPGWEVEPDGAGGLVLRLHAPPRAAEGRVLFYAPNSRVPTTVPTSSGTTAADATTLVIGSVIDVDDVGIVKIDSEYIAYYGITRGAATTTLNNLVHALHGSAAASHNGSTSVNWCIGMDDLRLNALLFDQWRAHLHTYFIQDGGVHERGMHEKAMGYHAQLAADFWPTYNPVRKSAGVTLNRKSFSLR